MGRKKKEVVEELQQTHAMDESAPITLDQVWGDNGLSKFQTFDEQEYENRLSELNLTDLQAEAYRIGLLPVQNREILTGRLMREFKRHSASFRKSTIQGTKLQESPDSDLSKKVRKLLSS